MKKYDAYKPSGIDWIGEVPSNWSIARLKFLFSRSIAGVWGDEEKGNNDDIVCFRVADFDYERGCLNLDDNTIRNIDRKTLKGRIVKRNDLLIEKSGGGDTSPVGRVVKVNTDIIATCSNFIHIVTVADGNESTFIYYYFKFLYSNKINLLFFNQTTGIQNLKIPSYLGQMLYLPPLAEQKVIAAYLDAKCAKIDNVVAVQRKRIELLKELKQSIITRAVTKGLDKTAKMKDSGIDWIGEIPEGWEIKKIKHNFEIYAGATPKTEKESFWDGDIVWITPADYKTDDKIVFQGERNITIEGYNSCNTQLVPQGSLIFSKRAPIGTVALNGVELCTNQGCLSCVPKKVNSIYYYYVIRICTESFDMLGSGATFKEISADSFANVKLPTPPLAEQNSIADYLDRKCAVIDRQIAKVEKQIELLNEYKLSVITECVTGKRKVC